MVACEKCGKRDANLLCSKCQATHYCSKECQYQHWGQKPNGHKEVCRPYRDVGGVFFEGLQKSSILDLANGKGGRIVRKLGYSLLTANALALQVPRRSFVAAIRHARGSLTPEWHKALSTDENIEINTADDSGGAEYVCFTTPTSAKKRKLDVEESTHYYEASQTRGLALGGLFPEEEKSRSGPRRHSKRSGSPSTSLRQTTLPKKDKKEMEIETESEQSEQPDTDDDVLEYTNVNKDSLINTEDEIYLGKVGLQFEDTEDDMRFEIVSVCACSDPKLGLFFKYRDPLAEEGDDFEYTPCSEIMEASWVKWRADDSEKAP